ncbi:MAG TPA: biotin/lipoyl-containing protein [Cyclobacteriaceae bacterium]|nr:biotin/lipoyl-containing protein [Cyclobacteriaceae bacterium]
MYKATVNNQTFDISPDEVNWDLVEYAPNCFHILYNNKSYRAEIVKTDPVTKTFVIKVNNVVQTVAVKDKFDLLLEKMGMNSSASSKINNIKAPMPGLIIDLKIKVGDTVNAGDALLILEAMKMENVLKSPGGGTVKSVKVKKGDSVEKGQVLIEF